MKQLLHFLCIATCSFTVLGQQISLSQQFNGHYNYTAVGNTLNIAENNSGVCDILPESSATLNLTNDQTLVAALLYWSGSAAGDFDVELNGNEVSAQRTFSHILNGLPYFAAYADVTDIVAADGNGTYTFSDMDIAPQELSSYCGGGTNYGGWSILIVYEDPSLLLTQVAIFDGLESVSATSNFLNITLTNINAVSDQLSKIGFLAWEGDQELAISESLLINNTLINNPPLNPSNNAFNSTNSFTNSTQLYNMDLDFYDLEGLIQPGDTQIDIELTSGQDFIMINNIVTAVHSELPDATIEVEKVVVSPQQDELEITYTVSNVNSTNVLPANTPIAFYAENVLIGQDVTDQDLQIGETLTEEINVTLPAATPSNFMLRAVIDGNGIIPETNEENNEFQFTVNLNPITINPPVSNLIACDDNNDGFFSFNLSQQDEVITEGDPNMSVTYYGTLTNAENNTSPLPNLYINDTAYVDAPITDSNNLSYGTGGVWARVENALSNEINIVPFALEVRSTPVGNAPEPLRTCDDANDGFETFDLTVVANEVLGSLDPAGFDFYYYEDLADATEAGDVAATNPNFSLAIPNPTNYINAVAFSQTMYVLLVSNSTGAIPPNPNSVQGCYDIVELTLIVDAKPANNGPLEMVLCDDEINGSTSTDAISTFDLTQNNAIITAGDPSLTVAWFLTYPDEQNNIPITAPDAYQNIATPQTVIARVTSEFGCKTLVTLTLTVLPNPAPNTSPTPLEICDDNTDGIYANWDLTVADAEIIGGEANVMIYYYSTIVDAEAGTAGTEIMMPYTNTIPFVQTVYARVTKNVPPAILPCYTIVELQLIVNEIPVVTQPNNLFIDEGDGDGTATFDLTVNNAVMLAGLNASEYTVFYYQTETDLQNDNPIADPMVYVNTQNPQTVYTRVQKNATSCSETASFEISTDETAPDTDGDGISDEDEDLNNNGNLDDDDTDGDGTPNYLDTDDDGDTVLTIDETTGIGAGVAPSYVFIDTDGDAIENYLDNDDDGDGTLTIDEDYNNNGNPIDDDTNSNGIPDFLDDAVFLAVNSFVFDDLSLYPNPTSESFTVQSSKLVSATTISIYDLQGKLLISEKVLPQNGKLIQNVSSLENGVYFVKISSEGNSAIKKLLKN